MTTEEYEEILWELVEDRAHSSPGTAWAKWADQKIKGLRQVLGVK